ncbi:autotransporter outer membrane beta-barrel domain-containing protein [Caballeronia sp. LjRoot29]|uniref:autotransporter family protein n=1 Tax=Caballeronia sp. LjRoot29 TaxID=3342315 RepID=UPI003ECEF46A
MSNPVRSRAISLAPSLLLIPFLLSPIAAAAACAVNGLDTVCNSKSPNPWTTTIGTGPARGNNNRTVTVLNGATIDTQEISAISLADHAKITVRSGGTVSTFAVGEWGNYRTGVNTIEFRDNGSLTVQAGGKVLSTGTENTAEAVNLQGHGNVITNSGLIQALNARAIWFQNVTGTNTVINNKTGVIESPGSVIGSTADAPVHFTNKGTVLGDIDFAGGDDVMRIYTGSSVSGAIDGGAGNNKLFLSGLGVDTLTGNIANFQTLTKTDAGTWTVNGIPVDVQSAEVAGGTLILAGDNSTYTGQMLVDAAGTLQGRAQSLPNAITDNGLVRFAQTDDGTYTGLLSGTGAIEKTGAGTLFLAPASTGGNTYSGGTLITQGTLNVAADNALGAATGGLTFNGGTLQLNNSLDLAATRAISIGDNGGTIDTQQYASTLSQGVTGTGSLTKLGSGFLTMNGVSTYGDTNVLAGTLAVGDAQHNLASIGTGTTTVAQGATLGGYGTVMGSVVNSGTIAAANALPAFSASSTGTFAIHGDLTNTATINLAAASGVTGNILNVSGNYAGGTNAQLIVNTVMNAGGPASNQFTDQLVIGGNATGSTLVTVRPSGLGALTVGDGIKIVQVNGTAAATAFHTAAPVQAGAYQYLLYQGGSNRPEDFYLRSSLETVPPVTTPPVTTPPVTTPPVTTPPATTPPATTPSDPGAVITPVTPIVSAGSPGSTPASQPSVIAYRPGVVGYTMTPSLNLDYGFSIMSRLHERVGDVASLENAQGTHGNGVWGRIGGQSLNADSGDRFSADERTFFAQFGKDWTLSTNPAGGSTHAGVTVTIGSSSATFEDSARSLNPTLTNATGSVETQAQSLGGYWTKYLKDGSYFDAVAQLTHYRNKFGDVYGGGASQNGVGTGLSGEVGKPFLIGSTTIAIEPQAQLMYQYLHLNGFDDGISPVSGTSSNALRGRAGFRIFKANLSNDTKTGAATPYFTADVLHDFLNPGNTAVDGAAFNSGLSKTWYEVGVGVTTSMSKSSEMYANVKYSRNIGGDYRQGVFGQVGYRYSW